MQDDDLHRLEEKIARARKVEEYPADSEENKNMNIGIRAGAELTGAIGGGAFIGWLLDRWLDTSPVFLIIMLLLGVATGFVNVYRLSQNLGTTIGYSELHRRNSGAKNAPEKEESPKS